MRARSPARSRAATTTSTIRRRRTAWPPRVPRQVAAANLIWQQAGTPVVTFDCPAGVTGRCVRVEVYRDGTNGSTALPTLFGPILGITSQKVKASATSIVGNGNATDCLRPIAFADDWQDNSANNQFNGSSDGLRGLPDYPSATETSTRLQAPRKPAHEPISADLRGPWRTNHLRPGRARRPHGHAHHPQPCGRADVAWRRHLSEQDRELQRAGGATRPDTPGVMSRLATPMFQAFNTLMAQDPGVDWNAGAVRIDNSCAPACAPVSPRLIAVALFDPRRFQLGPRDERLDASQRRLSDATAPASLSRTSSASSSTARSAATARTATFSSIPA